MDPHCSTQTPRSHDCRLLLLLPSSGRLQNQERHRRTTALCVCDCFLGGANSAALLTSSSYEMPSPVTNTLKQTSTSSCQHEKQNTRRCSRIRATCFACVCYVCVYPLVERERATCAPDGDRHSTEGSAGRVPCPYTHRAAPPSHGTV